MSFEVFTYSPTEVYLTLPGHTVSGWMNISIERSAKMFITKRGIRGKHTRVLNKDTSATITVSLLQVSPTNDVFNRILELDEQYGTGRIELQLADKSGSSVFKSNEAYITGYPAEKFSDGFEQRVWEIFCQSTEWATRGNSKPQQSVVRDVLRSLGIE